LRKTARTHSSDKRRGTLSLFNCAYSRTGAASRKALLKNSWLICCCRVVKVLCTLTL
jgi:hypothetical protein